MWHTDVMTQPFKNLKLLVIHHESETESKTTLLKKQDAFHRLSVKISNKLGNAWAFYIALLVIVCWAVSGPLFNFSDTWQLVINTSTTIVTFLMVFVIQNTQNRDGRAMQLKLDELINASRGARSKFVDIEDLSDEDLDQLEEQFKKIQEKIQSKSN